MTARAEPEVLSDDALSRLSADLRSALRRRPTHEPRLAGSVRVLVRHSAALRDVAVQVLDTMVKRGSFARPLYTAAARALGGTATNVPRVPFLARSAPTTPEDWRACPRRR
jgi:hypothetical protein